MLAKLSNRLISLAEYYGDEEAAAKFTVEKLKQLNRMSFIDVSYFLLKITRKGDVSSIPWPITGVKDVPGYMKAFHATLDLLKKQFPWCKIPPVQKSHFQAPSADNARVVSVLVKLSELAIFAMSGFSGESKTIEEIETDIKVMKEHTVQLQDKIEETEKRFGPVLIRKEYQKNLKKPEAGESILDTHDRYTRVLLNIVSQLQSPRILKADFGVIGNKLGA